MRDCELAFRNDIYGIRCIRISDTILVVDAVGRVFVAVYHWEPWKRRRIRRRNLIKLGANPDEVHMSSRSRMPDGLLAHEPQQHRATGPEQPTVKGARSARTEKYLDQAALQRSCEAYPLV